MSHPFIFEALQPGTWRATPLARGPFAGVHGGSVAGLMAAAIETQALPGARALSLRADFLRPTPVGVPLVVRVTPVQVGRRLSVFDATIAAEGRLTARCTLTMGVEIEVAALAEDFCSETAPPAADPQTLPRRSGHAAHGGPWIMDVLEGRRAPDSTVWFRWGVPLLPNGVSPFVAALGPADFAHGLARPGQPGPSPVPAFPNSDLSVQFDRAPRGEWIGVSAFTRWRRQGLGIGYGDLLDLDGAFGRVGMGVVLVPA